MKKIWYLLFLTVVAVGQVSKAMDCGAMPSAYHEFAVFGGNDRVFLSHYPMFSSAHAYQVVLEVALTADDHDAQKKFLDHTAAHPDLRYTFSPYRKVPPTANRVKDQDDWVLPSVAHVGAEFNGDIHYYASKVDTNLDYNVSARVVKVIISKLLDPKDPRPASLSYVIFGDANQAYLAHFISAPPNPGEKVPDFDQIIVGTVVLGPYSGEILSVPGRNNLDASKARAGETLNLRADNGDAVVFKVSSELFDHTIMTDR